MFSQVSLSLKIKQLQISIMTTKESYGINAFSSELVLAIEQIQRLFTIYMVSTNSGLINFVVESRLPFVQISFIPIEKRLRRRETGVKDGFEEWNTNFRLEHSVRKKQDYLVRCSVVTGHFPRERRKKSCSLNISELTAKHNRRRRQTLCEKRDNNFV